MKIEDIALKMIEYANKKTLFAQLRWSAITAVEIGEVRVNVSPNLRKALREQLYVELHDEATLFNEFLQQNSVEDERAILEQMLVWEDDK